MPQTIKQLLLINPWIYDFTAFDLWSKPLGLLYIAALLRKFAYQITFIDCLDNHTLKKKKYGQGKIQRTIVDKPEILNHIPRQFARYGISEDELKFKITQAPPPDAVLVTSMMTYWYPGPQHVVDIVKHLLPGVPVILGGIYASLLPDHALKQVQPDYIIEGPGESAVIKLLADLLHSSNNPPDLPQSLDDYPYPAFDILSPPHYTVVLTSRGCPFDCSFCAQKLISMPFNQRNPDCVVDEIYTHYRKYQVCDIAFYDDALFINRDKHIKVILKKLLDLRMPLRFHTPNGLFAGQIDLELAQLMRQSGFRTIRLSYETINKKKQREMSNKISDDAIFEAVNHLNSAGYQKKELEAYVIMGLPDQAPEEVLESMIFINNLGIRIRLASYSPIPGTLDFNRAVSSGLIEPDIDPLLTNKSIFPLQSPENYGIYRNLRLVQNLLNQAVMHAYSPFSDPLMKKVLRRIDDRK